MTGVPEPGSGPATWEAADPFELPEWLGTEPFTWSPDGPLAESCVRGTLAGCSGATMPLDLVCADAAYPVATAAPPVRHDAHQAWHFGQVLVVAAGGRAGVALPASALDADLACEALRRFAMAVGVPSGSVSIVLRL